MKIALFVFGVLEAIAAVAIWDGATTVFHQMLAGSLGVGANVMIVGAAVVEAIERSTETSESESPPEPEPLPPEAYMRG